MKRSIVAAVLLLAALAGCSHPPTHGTVTERKYRAAHYDDYITYYCAAYGKNGACTVHVPSFHHDYIGPRWQLCLRADDGDTKHDATGCIDVDQTTYDRYQAGSYYGG